MSTGNAYSRVACVQTPGQNQEDLFSLQACSIVPDLVTCLLKSSSQISVVWKTLQAIRQHIMNDPVFQQQHNAITSNPRSAAASAKAGSCVAPRP